MRIENSILCHNSTALKRNVDVLFTELVSLVWIVKINNTRHIFLIVVVLLIGKLFSQTPSLLPGDVNLNKLNLNKNINLIFKKCSFQ